MSISAIAQVAFLACSSNSCLVSMTLGSPLAKSVPSTDENIVGILLPSYSLLE
jgi:hypothetical protein